MREGVGRSRSSPGEKPDYLTERNHQLNKDRANKPAPSYVTMPPYIYIHISISTPVIPHTQSLSSLLTGHSGLHASPLRLQTIFNSQVFGFFSGCVNSTSVLWRFLACESLHVCTVCIWRCEHARFCV